MGNMLKTTLFLALLTGLFIAVGGLLGGRSGMMMAFVFALVMNFVTLLVLGQDRPRDVRGPARRRGPGSRSVHRIVRNLATRAGIPMPQVYLIPSDSPERLRDRAQSRSTRRSR